MPPRRKFLNQTIDHKRYAVVQAHPDGNLTELQARDKRWHLVNHARELNCLCGLMAAELLPFVKATDFGRTDISGANWCPRCARSLSRRESGAGI